jgi:hypothetical protein
MSSDRLKVLYIVGAGRSGSTILDTLLGQVDGFFSGGEISHAWGRGLIENRSCGCGKPFRECETWQHVFKRAFGEAEAPDPHEIVRYRSMAVHPRNFPAVARAAAYFAGEHQRATLSPLARYAGILQTLYEAIFRVTHARVVVDSSKNPGYGYLLSALPALDVRVVHLIRDPRGVAFSRLRGKFDPDSATSLPRSDPPFVSLAWDFWNLLAELLWHNRRRGSAYLRVRYEDFVSQPANTIEAIARFAGEASEALPFVNEDEAQVNPTHTVSGNPARFSRGVVRLQADVRWHSQMKTRDKVLVTLLTWPLLLRYKYPVFLGGSWGQR